MRSLPLFVTLLTACNPFGGGDGGGDDQPGVDAGPAPGTVFDPRVTDVVVEIDYEQGQEPFTGPIVAFGDTFDLSKRNIDRLFASKKNLVIPSELAAMQNIGAIADEELTVDDLLALADTHRDQADSSTKKTYYLLFVSGYFTDNNGPNQGVLGVSIGDTGVIAMFKDVIRSTNLPGFPNVVRFVEQATMIHELGHAIGLVNNGVPLATEHQDTEHGAHCTNDRCVMFWQVEGASEATQFVRDAVVGNDTILWGSECLVDVDALTGGP